MVIAEAVQVSATADDEQTGADHEKRLVATAARMLAYFG